MITRINVDGIDCMDCEHCRWPADKDHPGTFVWTCLAEGKHSPWQENCPDFEHWKAGT